MASTGMHPLPRFFARGLAAGLLALAGLAAQAATFPADMCVGDRVGSSLNCTANDVQITSIRIAPGSNAPPTCEGGSSLTLDLEVTVNFGSSTRYDVGIFLSQDGANPMEQSTRTVVGGTGSASCKVSTLPSPPPPGTSPTALFPFPNKDAGPYTVGGQQVYDTCGDGADKDLFGNSGTAVFVIPQVTVQCKSLNASGSLNVPFVVTWDSDNQNSGNICTGPGSVLPSTKSKCSSSSGTQADVAVVAMPKITKSDAVTSISPSDTVTYTIMVLNTTGITLSNAVFKDPAVANLNVSAVGCAAANATCPASSTVALMQGAGLVIPQMLAGGSVTFTVNAQLTGNPVGNLTNTATITVNGGTSSASDVNAIVYPNLVNTKTVRVVSDPVNGTTNPKNIPGSESIYTVAVANTGQGRVDTSTMRIVDPIPANTALFVGNLGSSPAGPVGFSDAGSGLTFTSTSLSSTTDDVEFSKDGGVSWTYTPVPDGSGFDAAVTHLRLSPKGRMNGWGGSGAYPGFSFTFKVKLK